MNTLSISRIVSLALLSTCVALALPAPVAVAGDSFADARPSPQQVAWQDRAFGVIVHFGTNTFLDREWGDGKAAAAAFDPDAVDPGQWARAAKAAGASYLILVAKHHDGFALWPTGQSDYSVKRSPWLKGQGDLVRMTSEAVKKAGMGLGIYLSPWDRHEPRYAMAPAYDKYYAAQLSELARNYGPLVEWWLDGAGSAGHVYDFESYVNELRTYQPNTLVFADVGLFAYGDVRWVGKESGAVDGENWNVIDRHGALRWRPVEADTPLHENQWFWHPGAAYEADLKSVDELVRTWEQSVGRGAQLVLGLAPDRHGLLPEADVKRLAEFGQAIEQRYGAAANLAAAARGTVAVCPAATGPACDAGAALDGDPATFWTAPDAAHATLEIDLGHPVTFDRSLVMERLDEGQNVRRYSVQVWQGGAWRTVAGAEAIGHMKIDGFPAVTAQRVRLNILSSVGIARIREFALFMGAY
jgi:alpha-L-fucosidase